MSQTQSSVGNAEPAALPLGGAIEPTRNNSPGGPVPCFSDSPQSVRVLENGRGERRDALMTDDFWEYLKFESARRGISTMEVFDEEEAAGKAIASLGLTEDFFASAVRRSNPPAKYLEGDQECPF
jgi:hypothetical protein